MILQLFFSKQNYVLKNAFSRLHIYRLNLRKFLKNEETLLFNYVYDIM